ncbi:Clavaminate synthase-like protein [Penicillium verhagenii]|nr:Clavaminate synthase-like protein [Penicillium verhagenii]
MHRFLRSLHTSGSKATSHYCQPTKNQRISDLVPLLNVTTEDLAFQSSHLKAVHQTLETQGVLQLQLGFPDDDSEYLQKLIFNLHKKHQHGLPITHSAERGWFWDVRPSPDSFQTPGHQARSETMHRFDWHTDCCYEIHPPRYFALQVLQPDRCGGGTLSLLNVDRMLTLLSPFARKWLSTPNYRINVPPEFMKEAGEKHIRGNLLALKAANHQGGSQLRFREDIMTPLTENCAKALDELKSVLFGEAVQTEILHLDPEILPRGSIILMDNQRWLHSRNEVKDPRRHLRRVRWGATPFGDSSI